MKNIEALSSVKIVSISKIFKENFYYQRVMSPLALLSLFFII